MHRRIHIRCRARFGIRCYAHHGPHQLAHPGHRSSDSLDLLGVHASERFVHRRSQRHVQQSSNRSDSSYASQRSVHRRSQRHVPEHLRLRPQHFDVAARLTAAGCDQYHLREHSTPVEHRLTRTPVRQSLRRRPSQTHSVAELTQYPQTRMSATPWITTSFSDIMVGVDDIMMA